MTAGIGARAEAARALAQVLHRGRSLRDLLPAADSRLPDSRDRALLRALLRATLRTVYRQRAVLARLMEKPLTARAAETEAVLLVGFAQIEAAIGPDYAAVAGAVDAARALGQVRHAGLVNAVLRRYLRERETLLAGLPDDEQVRSNHPRWLLETLRRDWPDHWRVVLEGNDRESPIWLRVRANDPGRAAYLDRLRSSGIEAEPHPGLPDALRLDSALDPGSLPGVAEGQVHVQDGAAQLCADLLALAPGLRVLDACAAPGGKALHAIEREPRLELTALERDPERAGQMTRRFARIAPAIAVRAADATDPRGWWDGVPYDRILLDAPCSATGVIRRHPEIRVLRRADDLPAQVQAQARLLDALWPMLAPGGRLVYATCSVLRDENDRQITRWLARTGDARALDLLPAWFGVPLAVGRQNLPGMGALDGFYYAVVEKARA